MLPRSIDWQKYDRLLGTMIDRDLAAIIGCTKLAVLNRRKLLRIPSATVRKVIAEYERTRRRK